jgi:hypothetical protein
MLRNDHALADTRQNLRLIEAHAKKVLVQFQNFVKETEASKVDSLQKLLEQKIKSEALRRGAASVIKDRSRLRTSLVFTAGSFIAGGLLSRDKWVALDSGIAGLNGALQVFGRSRWFVLFAGRIVVIACDSTPPPGNWLALESLKPAMEDLKKRALTGETLGNLDDVLHKLQQGIRSLPMSTSPSVNQTATRANWKMVHRNSGAETENN